MKGLGKWLLIIFLLLRFDYGNEGKFRCQPTPRLDKRINSLWQSKSWSILSVDCPIISCWSPKDHPLIIYGLFMHGFLKSAAFNFRPGRNSCVVEGLQKPLLLGTCLCHFSIYSNDSLIVLITLNGNQKTTLCEVYCIRNEGSLSKATRNVIHLSLHVGNDQIHDSLCISDLPCNIFYIN